MSKTIIRIISESALGSGILAFCEHRAAALYFLAYRAAVANLQLETITTDLTYKIGSVEYTLDEHDVFTTETVSRFRKQHEALLSLWRQPGYPGP